MKQQTCEINQHIGMNFMHCKVRQRTYFTVAALILFALGATAFMSMRASAADEQNPIEQNVAAPELVGSDWVNTPNREPIRLADRKGKVTLVHFWTFGCINCKHNLPAYNRWYKQLADKDIAIIGVHTPETPDETRAVNVRAAIKHNGISYPVLIDTDHKNWDRWHQQFWPTIYLIDKHGRIRYRWEGELEYDGQNGTAKVTQLISELQNEK